MTKLSVIRGKRKIENTKKRKAPEKKKTRNPFFCPNCLRKTFHFHGWRWEKKVTRLPSRLFALPSLRLQFCGWSENYLNKDYFSFYCVICFTHVIMTPRGGVVQEKLGVNHKKHLVGIHCIKDPRKAKKQSASA